MQEPGFYEKIHKATASEPYLNTNSVNLNYTSHFHEEIELIFVFSGSVELFVDGRIYTANSGNIGIIMPGEIHSYTSVKSEIFIMKMNAPANLENIDFSLIRLKSNLLTEGESESIYHQLKALIKEMMEEDNKKEKGYQIAISKCTYTFLLLMIRNLEYDFISPEANKKITNKLLFLKTAYEYVENNYANSIQLQDAANHCGYSLYYFAHYFKEITNITFVDYLSQFRLEKVRQLLLISDKKLTDIAFSCGFHNIRSFNRVFKNQYKMSPSTYRKSMVGA